MCVPALAAAPLLTQLVVASTAVSAIGGAVAAASAVSQNNYQAKVADANAKRASAQASDAIERGKVDQQRVAREYSQRLGAQRAALAADGVDPGFGTASDILGDTQRAAATDQATTIQNSERQAAGFDISASNYTAEGASDRMKATAAGVGGVFDFGSTVLSGATQVQTIKARGY